MYAYVSIMLFPREMTCASGADGNAAGCPNQGRGAVLVLFVAQSLDQQGL